MLYITTRNNKDAFTAHKALTEDFAPDGGGYVPFRLPALNLSELESLSGKQFSECIATILNLFFSPKLTAWDVEFAIGRNPLKMVLLNGKVTIAELHSNPEGRYGYFVKALYKNLIKGTTQSVQPSVWLEIAVRIATLYGVWCDMVKQGLVTVRDIIDISLSSDDYYAYAAALYARKMGLPIGIVVLSCNEGNSLWEIVSRGEAKADAFSATESEMVERILENVLGRHECVRYLTCRIDKKQYVLSEEDCERMKTNLFATTIGNGRVASTASNVAKKDGYTLNCNTARSYAGIEDYRARCGISRHALIIAESGK